jgi:hypothetical protein
LIDLYSPQVLIVGSAAFNKLGVPGTNVDIYDAHSVLRNPAGWDEQFCILEATIVKAVR